MKAPVLSVVVPVYNETSNIRQLYAALEPIVRSQTKGNYEIIFVDDGSTDGTAEQISGLNKQNRQVKLLCLSRNFGKEMAMAAGIASAHGEAILTIDGDGQHPADRIPDFVDMWRNGAQVVVGVRTANSSEGIIKRCGSRMFYSLFNRLSGATMIPGSSDFRLISQEVQQEFIKLHEPHTITRGLIDWLGFERRYVYFAANPRIDKTARYKPRALVRLAVNSFVSLSPTPLYAFGYLGLMITSISFVLGVSVLIEQLLLGDPLGWAFSGTAMLSILVLFLIGLVLMAQGVLALYISYIHTQAKGRPLYIVNHRQSLGFTKTD